MMKSALKIRLRIVVLWIRHHVLRTKQPAAEIAPQTSPGPPTLAAEPQSTMPTESRPKKRKALLIGIASVHTRCDNPAACDLCNMRKRRKSHMSGKSSIGSEGGAQQADYPVLKGPKNDVEMTKALLLEVYDYKLEDIVTLVDGDDKSSDTLPTRDNIRKQIAWLVADSQPGDRYYFHFSGHAIQQSTDDPKEEDNMDEFICTYENDTIVDDELYKWLVEPLHKESSMIAVFDCCNAGSILDLHHWRCNQVSLPWINRGERKTASKHYNTRRAMALPMTSAHQDHSGSPATPVRRSFSTPSRQESLDQVLNSNSATVVIQPSRWFPLETDSVVRHDCDAIDEERRRMVTSPIGYFCEGWCRPWFSKEKQADVICFSSCADGQVTLEKANGESVTAALVDFLRDNPHPTFKCLMHRVSKALHSYYVDYHSRARGWRKKRRIYNLSHESCPVEGESPEMNNFQTLQLSSHEPLDMNRRWNP